MQSIAFGSSCERRPVSLYMLSLVSMFQKHLAVITGQIVDAKLSSVTQPTLPPDPIQLGHNG